MLLRARATRKTSESSSRCNTFEKYAASLHAGARLPRPQRPCLTVSQPAPPAPDIRHHPKRSTTSPAAFTYARAWSLTAASRQKFLAPPAVHDSSQAVSSARSSASRSHARLPASRAPATSLSPCAR